MNKELVKEEETDVVVRFGDQIDFNELFRVKGKKGLFVLGSKVNKSGMVRMIGFLDYEKSVTTNQNNLVCLGHLRFQTEMGKEPVLMNDVFSNLHEFYQVNKDKEVTPELSDFVPNYDPNEFKMRHAVQVLGWFDEVITKITENEIKSNDKKED